MKKRFLPVLAGFILGVFLCGGVFAAGILANPADSKVTVDGKPVTVGAYNIDNANYFKLRDFAAAVDVGVWFDQSANTIHIETDKKYDPNYTGPASEVAKTTAYKVARVVDGDTFIIDFSGTEERVRMIGIDTPESVHPDQTKNTEAGLTASEYTKSLLEGEEVELEFDVQERDQYGRLLAYVYLDGIMVNKTLLKEGYAVLSTWPPNVKYVDDFTQIVNETRDGDPNVKTTGTYVGSVDSDKYHYPTCRYADSILDYNKIWFDTKEEATKAGYVPCGTCKP